MAEKQMLLKRMIRDDMSQKPNVNKESSKM